MTTQFITRVQVLGRVVIPKAHRDAEQIQDGDLVEVTVRKVKPKS